MAAKEMFEELGFKEDLNNCSEYNPKCYVKYTVNGKEEIVFHKNKHFATFLNDRYSYVRFKELQAINKQIEELGWNNE